jgi:hypothetical protein
MSRTESPKSLAAVLCCAALLAACAGGPLTRDVPVRSDAAFSRVTPGMPQDEVLRMFGPPDEAMAFPLSRTHAWTYVYQDTWGFAAEYSITFDGQDRAVSMLSKRIGYGGGDQGSR